jgi:hypothetical protein
MEKKLSPQNLTAQLAYRARGNPPSSGLDAAPGNTIPGIEVDFRNLWRRVFVGIELHEARPFVVRVKRSEANKTYDKESARAIHKLRKHYLVAVDGKEVCFPVTGPQREDDAEASVKLTRLVDWSNVLADVVRRPGETVECIFSQHPQQNIGDAGQIKVRLKIRQLFDHDENNPAVIRPAFARETILPGEFTQGLCSPWQSDFLECACYYWAASRPDYVNVNAPTDPTQKGSRGRNWLHKEPGANAPLQYSLNPDDLVDYDDMFQAWEKHLNA